MTIADFDKLDLEKKKEILTQCCGSTAWVGKMVASPPAEDLVDLIETAEEKWYECSEQDWLEAFEHHPKIGDKNLQKEKFGNSAQLAAKEQSGVDTASEKVLEELAKHNQAYEGKFGYIFIVCATGKSAEEMLRILLSRLNNSPADEIKNAAEEQNKITALRLQKLFV